MNKELIMDIIASELNRTNALTIGQILDKVEQYALNSNVRIEQNVLHALCFDAFMHLIALGTIASLDNVYEGQRDKLIFLVREG